MKRIAEAVEVTDPCGSAGTQSSYASCSAHVSAWFGVARIFCDQRFREEMGLNTCSNQQQWS